MTNSVRDMARYMDFSDGRLESINQTDDKKNVRRLTMATVSRHSIARGIPVVSTVFGTLGLILNAYFPMDDYRIIYSVFGVLLSLPLICNIILLTRYFFSHKKIISNELLKLTLFVAVFYGVASAIKYGCYGGAISYGGHIVLIMVYFMSMFYGIMWSIMSLHIGRKSEH